MNADRAKAPRWLLTFFPFDVTNTSSSILMKIHIGVLTLNICSFFLYCSKEQRIPLRRRLARCTMKTLPLNRMQNIHRKLPNGFVCKRHILWVKGFRNKYAHLTCINSTNVPSDSSFTHKKQIC